MKNLFEGKQENGSKVGERERESGYFQNIFQELKVEDHVGFKDMFRLKVADYKFLFNSLMTETVII